MGHKPTSPTPDPLAAFHALYRQFADGAEETRFSAEVRQTYRECADKVWAVTQTQQEKPQ